MLESLKEQGFILRHRRVSRGGRTEMETDIFMSTYYKTLSP